MIYVSIQYSCSKQFVMVTGPDRLFFFSTVLLQIVNSDGAV